MMNHLKGLNQIGAANHFSPLLPLILFAVLFLYNCKSTEPFSGYSYDPPDVTNTEDKEIIYQKKRVIGIGEPKIWISNEFDGARVSDAWLATGSSQDTVIIEIEPENAPINNSPWYAFQIWSDQEQKILIRLSYENGRHRYKPKISESADLTSWKLLPDSIFTSIGGDLLFSIQIGIQKQWIAAHPVQANSLESLLNYPEQSGFASKITVDTVGYSHNNRVILQWQSQGDLGSEKKGLLILFSRQHPPEVSGYRSFLYFFNRLMDTDELAQNFRSNFRIIAYPMLNPDGVEQGHWRHNSSGIDLNRDWEYFRQPETRSVRDALSPLADGRYEVVYGIDFHSTNENVFYPINEAVITGIDNFTQRWFPFVAGANPELNFRKEEFEPNSPIAKNWVYKTFGTDALTFEVEDELNEEEMQNLGRSAAESLMKLLLNEVENTEN